MNTLGKIEIDSDQGIRMLDKSLLEKDSNDHSKCFDWYYLLILDFNKVISKFLYSYPSINIIISIVVVIEAISIVVDC